MKILVNRRIVNGPWGGGNKFTKALKGCATEKGHSIVEKFENDIDIIHLQDLHADELGIDADTALQYKRRVNPKVKIIHRVNDMDLGRCDSKPWRDKAYINFSQFIDGTIFVSEWTKDFFIKKGWLAKNNFVATNGVDKSIFHPQNKKNNEKINIVTHHWSYNKGKGFKIYEKIDKFVEDNKEFTFTYIGRERGTFKSTNIVKPLFGKPLGKELSSYDVYISASEYENCPNHILESLACNIPTYACKLGGASIKIVGEEHVFDSWEHLKSILLLKKFPNNKYKPLSWQEAIYKYFEIYEDVLTKNKVQ
jgi:hypothetical protein